MPIVVPSRGSKLLGSTLKTDLTKQEVKETLVDGFFPVVDIDEHPVQKSRGALTQMGLPYAQDAGITRHIAAFLAKQSDSTQNVFGGMFGQQEKPDFVKPTAVLFNGGVLKAEALSERLIEVINLWLNDADAESAKLLEGSDLDLAVASGAAITVTFVKAKAFVSAAVLHRATTWVSRARCQLSQVWRLQWKRCVWLHLVWKKALQLKLLTKSLALLSVSQFTSNSTAQPPVVMTSRVLT